MAVADRSGRRRAESENNAQNAGKHTRPFSKPMRAQTTSIDWAAHLSQIEFDPQLSVRVEHDATISLERLRDVVQGRVFRLEACGPAGIRVLVTFPGGCALRGSVLCVAVFFDSCADALPLISCQRA